MAGEFDLIRKYLTPLTEGTPGALSLDDDAALLQVPAGEELVVTADAMAEGVHFLSDDPPDGVAQKLLRVNLSDLAAMGAAPLGYLVTAALPAAQAESWMAALAEGLARDQERFGIALLGGDTTRSGAGVVLSLTALGSLPPGRALRRGTARDGDLVFVSGSIGDAYLGLQARQGGLTGLDPDALARLVGRYRLPEPRLDLGQALRAEGLANAAIDVSDGLVADLGHIARTSGLGARIEAAAVPLSPAARAVLSADPTLLPKLVGGGDDYELLFTAAPEREAAITALADRLGLALTRIGRMAAGQGVTLVDPQGAPLASGAGGWTHF